MMAGRFATPMIVPPQVAIIGIGKIEQRAVLSKKGKVKTKTVIPLSLSFDHRVLTGAEAAQFLAAFISHLKK
jgi:pyruvate dehydrogenase E2 component (dihydrolipoamide acetyltransferase)